MIDQSTLDKIIEMHAGGTPKVSIAGATGLSRGTVAKYIKNTLDHNPQYYEKIRMKVMDRALGRTSPNTNVDVTTEDGHIKDIVETDPDEELVEENVKLAKQVQHLRDVQRIERKSFREHARVDTSIKLLHEQMKDVLVSKELHKLTKEHPEKDDNVVGVVQLSDLHFNELVQDLDTNKFDFEVASKRLRKFIRKAKKIFKANGVDTVGLFMTGDLLNSDRRLDEITNAASNRSRAVFLAVDIIQQLILDLNQDFNVTVSSITGNESRVGEHVHYGDFLAGDSYDIVIHNMLTYLFKGSKGVEFIPVTNPLEQVVEVNGNNFLLVHGHVHRGIARNPESEIEKIKARYAARGTLISYVIMGHIHCAQISDLYARSSGLPGNNAYSERALNLSGRASQNIFLVYEQFGEIDGIKIDLQNVDGEQGYAFDNTLASYKKKSLKGTYTIQSVVV